MAHIVERSTLTRRIALHLDPKLAEKLWQAARVNHIKPADQVRVILAKRVRMEVAELYACPASRVEPPSVDGHGKVRLVVFCSMEEAERVAAMAAKDQWHSASAMVVALLQKHFKVRDVQGCSLTRKDGSAIDSRQVNR